MREQKIPSLPASNDEYWEDAEKYSGKPVRVKICKKHFYIDNHDGTVTCKFCPWGTKLPGYMRLLNNKLIDLRSFKGE